MGKALGVASCYWVLGVALALLAWRASPHPGWRAPLYLAAAVFAVTGVVVLTLSWWDVREERAVEPPPPRAGGPREIVTRNRNAK